MKDWNELKGISQNEALVNEFKGNLFEYLLGSAMAKSFGVESSFVNDFDQQNGGLSKSALVSYQQKLIESDPALYRALPKLAQSAFDFLGSHTTMLSEAKWQQVIVVGKMAAAFGDDSLGESDLLLIDNSNNKLGLSLKLVKKSAFVNTKSGGIRSFLVKYFSPFDRAQAAQDEVNEFLDQSFAQMLFELYELKDLDVEVSLSGQRSIDPLWVESGFSELPGELDGESREIVHAHYHRVAKVLEAKIREFYETDRSLFLSCLAPLLGFGFKEIRQLTCFHDDGYEKSNFVYECYEDLEKDLSSLIFTCESEAQQRKMKSGFELTFGDHILQIRLKPMNKFTVSGLKVNCSVKIVRKIND